MIMNITNDNLPTNRHSIKADVMGVRWLRAVASFILLKTKKGRHYPLIDFCILASAKNPIPAPAKAPMAEIPADFPDIKNAATPNKADTTKVVAMVCVKFTLKPSKSPFVMAPESVNVFPFDKSILKLFYDYTCKYTNNLLNVVRGLFVFNKIKFPITTAIRMFKYNIL